MATRPILIVDNNAVNRFAMQALVTRLGFAVELADGGKAAIEAIRATSFAAVLLDIMMPEMNGYQTAEHIRELERGTSRHMPLIAITALDKSPAFDAACRVAGIDDAITKPVSADILGEKLKKWLNLSVLPADSLAARTAKINGLSVETLRELYGSADLPAILQAFFEVTSTLLMQLQATMHQKDSGTAERMIHELKSGVYVMHVKELADLCHEMEHARKEGDWEKMSALYKALADAFTHVRGVLRPPGAALEEGVTR
jgi:CheY-like chemotaxis protein/HPt (histidine-containing phosphotransfer) domain-containing protein